MSYRARRARVRTRPAELASLKQSSGAHTLAHVASRTFRSFHSTVWRYWREEGRHELAWRLTTDPYKILVSEIMLQQTQVPRVKEKYEEFLKAFPSVRALAQASLSEVLKHWSGLGYNRRGKYLHEAAKEIVAKHKGRVPRDYAALRALPGVGDYTARAVRAFAFNTPEVLIETNVRAAIIHHFFPVSLQKRYSVKLGILDSEVISILERVGKGQDPREWNWALMDYGAHIKKLHGNPARRSAQYKKQSKFEGSLRQVRGAILKARAQEAPLSGVRDKYADRFEKAYASLVRDGLVAN